MLGTTLQLTTLPYLGRRDEVVVVGGKSQHPGNGGETKISHGRAASGKLCFAMAAAGRLLRSGTFYSIHSTQSN